MPKYEFHVDVQTVYQPQHSAPDQGVYRFAYTITITNTGDGLAQLVARHWRITDGHGLTQEVRGLGVVGRQPALEPGASHSYTSGCELRTPTGHMQGHFLCVSEHGDTFECPVPVFMLDAQALSATTPSHPSNHTLH